MSNFFDMQNIIARIVAKYERLHSMIIDEFGVNGVYVLLLFVFFLVVIFIIYTKSVIDTFKWANPQFFNKNKQQGLFYTYTPANTIENSGMLYLPSSQDDKIDEEEYDDIIEENNTENGGDYLSADEELSRSLIIASAVSDDILNVREDYNNLKRKMSRHAKNNNRRLLNWRENYAHYIEKYHPKSLPEVVLTSEQQKKKDIHDLVCTILNLLGRQVSVSKIAQAVFFHSQERYSEQDIIQLIQTIRDFIGLCNSGHFEVLPNRENLPSNKEAIYAWAHGETTPCLTLLQSYLNMLMEQSSHEQGIIKEMTYAQAANCACIMGNIARMTDTELAHNSFELATELSPKSTNAWSNLADIYVSEQNKDRAMIAYQTVLELGDNIMYSWQLANAQENLADYYENLGIAIKSQELRQQCSKFYKDYGIRMPLSAAEIAAFSMIFSQKDNNLNLSLESLLSNEITYNR